MIVGLTYPAGVGRATGPHLNLGGPVSPESTVSVPTTGVSRAGFLKRAAVTGAGLTGAGSLVAAEALAAGKPGASHGGHGLFDRVNRISQMVCNVSDLERAKEFWERFTPMRAFAKTATPQQAFKSLGIPSGRFEGYLLRDMWDPGDVFGRGQFELHLVEWKDPKPVGVPYSNSRNVGWYRFAFKTRDTFVKYDELVAGGVTPYAPPNPNPPPPLLPVTGYGFPDPDGITIQILRGLPHLPDRLSHTACPVLDLQRQSVFYREVLGLVMISRSSSCAIPNPWDRGGKPGPYEAMFQRARGDTKITLDVLQWGGDNPSFGPPYQAPNNLGYAQLVLEVDDIAESYRILRRLQHRKKRADFRLAGPPEVWDLGRRSALARSSSSTTGWGFGTSSSRHRGSPPRQRRRSRRPSAPPPESKGMPARTVLPGRQHRAPGSKNHTGPALGSSWASASSSRAHQSSSSRSTTTERAACRGPENGVEGRDRNLRLACDPSPGESTRWGTRLRVTLLTAFSADAPSSPPPSRWPGPAPRGPLADRDRGHCARDDVPERS